MWRELIAFHWQLLCEWWLPDWHREGPPETHHFHRRRFTRQYQRKKQIVYRLWLGYALVILLIPALLLAAVGGLFVTFVSFAILDESS